MTTELENLLEKVNGRLWQSAAIKATIHGKIRPTAKLDRSNQRDGVASYQRLTNRRAPAAKINVHNSQRMA